MFKQTSNTSSDVFKNPNVGNEIFNKHKKYSCLKEIQMHAVTIMMLYII